MSDQTMGSVTSSRERKRHALEYWSYFAIVFLVAVPISSIQWMIALFQFNISELKQGIFARAWRKAEDITPMIFAA